MSRRRGYSVRPGGLHDIEYRDKERKVVFNADLRDHAVYLGYERVAGPPMTDAERETIIRRVYEYVNDGRGMRIDFLWPDGRHWGEPQGWEARAWTEEDRQKYIVRYQQRAHGNWFQRLLTRLGIG